MIGGIENINGYVTKIKLLLYLCVLLLCSCNNKHDNLPLRTVIIYMIADNNLDYFSVKNINEMEAGFNNNYNGNLLVYVDRAEGATPSHPIVYKISQDTTEAIMSEVAFVYEEQNSANETVMTNSLLDIIQPYPAQSYGLILWSHGTAWYPEGANISNLKNNDFDTTLRQSPYIKSFGKDGTDELCIKKLKNALPIHFDFILFDACYMGSVEVAYELKDNAHYIISSPTEVLSTGYPYQHIIEDLFEPHVNYEKIAHTFFISYDTLSSALQSATVSVIKTANLIHLAHAVSKIMNDTNKLQVTSVSKIQQYTANEKNFLFDIEDFICNITHDSNQIEACKKALDDVVVFKASTPSILGELKIKKFSGLSIYVPDSSNYIYYDYYKTLDWYKSSAYCNYCNMCNYSK